MPEPATEIQESERTTPAAAVREAVARLEREAKARTEVAKALKALAKDDAYADLAKYAQRVAKLAKALAARREQLGELGVAELVTELEGYAARTAAEQRRRLARELKARCEAEGIAFRVVRAEEPVELRLAPLAVELDFAKGRAKLAFARHVLAECRADADDVLKSYRATMKSLDARFDAKSYFESCWSAYRATLASINKRMGERVEILDFLPRLALELQPKRFRVDPRKENFQDYTRARFAYDVLRLKRAGALEQDGRRLQLGVATGTSATQKDRVVYFEDEQGQGEYKLTVFFKTDGRPDEP